MFEPANELESSLMKAAENPAHRPQFYRDLLQSDLFTIVVRAPKPDPSDPSGGETVVFQNMERDGEVWLPIFTSLNSLSRCVQPGTRYCAYQGRTLLEMTLGMNLVLNPGLEVGKDFSPKEIQRLLDGSIFEPDQLVRIETGTDILIGQPEVYPTKLVMALSDLFARDRSIKTAHLAQVQMPGEDEKPHLLIVVDTEGNWKKIVGDIVIIVKHIYGPKECIDFMRLEDARRFSDYLILQTPFYKRNKSFLEKWFG